MSQVDYWRQADILPQQDSARYPLVVIGAGGIGSPTTVALAKMGFSTIQVFDHDKVEPHNLPNQMYRVQDLGKPKVQALAEICREFADLEINPMAERFIDQPVEGIVISGLDSMAARKEVWAKLKYNIRIKCYVEARMGAEVARVHTVRPCDPGDVEWYETTLYSDEEALEAPCTARAVIYNVFGIAGFIGNQVKRFVRNQPYSREIIWDYVTMTLLTT